MEFLETFLGNSFALSDVEDNTPSCWIEVLVEVLRANFFGFHGFFNFINSKFGSFKDPFAMICKLVCKLMILQLACLNFTLDSQDLYCWFKRKNRYLWIMAAAQAAENHGDEWGLTWYLRWGIFTSIPFWTHSQNPSYVNSLDSRGTPGSKVLIYLPHDF